MSTLHGSAVARNGRGVLILGASGAGKSALALQLMALGADLLADDGVILERSDEGVTLFCPAAISGMIEARGVGLLLVNAIDATKLAIVVDLDKTAPSRLPAPDVTVILGYEFPLICGKKAPNLAAIVWCLLGGGQILPVE